MKTKKMEEVFKFGQMVHVMMVFGKMEWQMAMEDLSMQKAMFTKVNGLKIKLMAMEFTLILMEVVTKDNGTKINNMDTESNNGLMVQSTKVNMNKE